MMMLRICALWFLMMTLIPTAPGQEIQRLDPSVSQLIPADAKLERVAAGFDKWTEGPVWTREGSLLFAEIPANRIRRWKPGAKDAEVFMKHDHLQFLWG